MEAVAIIKAVMPLIEKLIDMLSKSSDTYRSSAKTDEDTDKFLEDIQSKLPEIERLFEENGIDFKTSGDLDHSGDVSTLLNALEQLKSEMTDPADIAKLERIIEDLKDARDVLLAREAGGDSKGEADFEVITGDTMSITPGSIYYGSTHPSP